MPFLLMTLNKIPNFSKCLSSCLSNAKSNGPFSAWWLQSLWTTGDKISVLSADGAELIFRTTCLRDTSRTIFVSMTPGPWGVSRGNQGTQATGQGCLLHVREERCFGSRGRSRKSHTLEDPLQHELAAQLTCQEVEPQPKTHLQNPVGPHCQLKEENNETRSFSPNLGTGYDLLWCLPVFLL